MTRRGQLRAVKRELFHWTCVLFLMLRERKEKCPAPFIKLLPTGGKLIECHALLSLSLSLSLALALYLASPQLFSWTFCRMSARFLVGTTFGRMSAAVWAGLGRAGVGWLGRLGLLGQGWMGWAVRGWALLGWALGCPSPRPRPQP